MVAQSTAQAVDGYAGLGALVRRQAEVGQVAFSERPVLAGKRSTFIKLNCHIADIHVAKHPDRECRLCGGEFR